MKLENERTLWSLVIEEATEDKNLTVTSIGDDLFPITLILRVKTAPMFNVDPSVLSLKCSLKSGNAMTEADTKHCFNVLNGLLQSY